MRQDDKQQDRNEEVREIGAINKEVRKVGAGAAAGGGLQACGAFGGRAFGLYVLYVSGGNGGGGDKSGGTCGYQRYERICAR